VEGETTGNDTLDKNAYCVDLYSSMMRSFEKDFKVKNNGNELTVADLGITQKFEAMLPDEYAGAFIDEDNILHVKFIGKSNMKKYTSIFSAKDSRVVYEYATVSLTTLLAIQDALDLVMRDFDIAFTTTDEINNGLKIGLLDISRKKEVINYLRENISDLPVENLFFEESSKCTFTATAAPGTNITKSYPSAWMSVGYNAYKSSTGKYGVITAGHGTTVGTIMYGSSTSLRLGMTSLVKYSSGTIDAAFVPFDSAYSPQKSSDFSQIVLTPLVTPVGMTTYKRGNISGYNTGTLTSASASCTAGGYTYTDQVVVSNSQQGGDSGGPVWVKSGGVGNLFGIATIGISGGAVASKAYNINAAFGVSLYK
jgi:hypothetical protein